MSEANGNGHAAVDLYRRYRPKCLEEMVGQAAAVKTIRGFGTKIPKAVMLTGSSGCGKTTLARIMCRIADVNPSIDLYEINCGVVESPLDTVRGIQEGLSLSPLGGKKRAWILDEVQALSRAGFAQQAMLKILEDGPEHAHFFLCTTDPKKVLPAVRNRCTQITVDALSAADLTALVKRVAAAERADVSERVVEKIVESAAGSARAALVELQKVAGIKGEPEQLAAVGVNLGAERVAYKLIKLLMPFKGSPDWREVRKFLTEIKDEDPESIRCQVMAAARTSLLREGKPDDRAYAVIQSFRDPWYDRASGAALLAASCYEICMPRR